MTINAHNNTAGTLTYTALGITILSGANYSIPNSTLINFVTDPNVYADISANNLYISDTVTTYMGDAAINFLKNIIALAAVPSTGVTSTGTMSALNHAVTISTTSMGSLIAYIDLSFSGTITFEATLDGSTWVGWVGMSTTTLDFQSAANGGGTTQFWIFPVSGIQQFRLRMSTWISGDSTSTIAANPSFSGMVMPFTGYPNSVGSFPVELTKSDITQAVSAPTLTKGTQGANGWSTQALHDAGRTQLRYYAVAAAAGTTGTETAITLTKSSGTAATSTGTSFVITNAKKFRITNIICATRGHSTATAQTTTFNLRINTGGAVTTSSTPIVLALRSATPATASAWDRAQLSFPEGYEIAGDGTLQFGITANATYTTNAPTWDVIIEGYEY